MKPALGIFARTFSRPDLDGVLAAVAAHGFGLMQFNLSCAGLESLPDRVEPQTCRDIRAAVERHGLRLAAVSGTFNAIHPDKAVRRQGIERCQRLIAVCGELGAPMVSLCTGTRDPQDMWRHHPANATASAWADLLETVGALLPVAERCRVMLGIEPETANVVDSALAARRLLTEIRSDRLAIIFDGANLIKDRPNLNGARAIEAAFDLLGPDIAMVHVKELAPDGSSRPCPPGAGRMEWATYFRLLRGLDPAIPVVIHGLPEGAVASAKAFVEQGLAAPAGSRP